MENWEKAAEIFIQKWITKENVEGFLVCGSYVTGAPSKRSDIDLHIVLSPGVDYRERGTEVINGFLIEYFMNPPAQIQAYFEDDIKSNRKHAAHMFTTGKILHDRNGYVRELQTEANDWMEKEYPELDKISVELNKYSLWDLLDNLQDAYESGSTSFTYTYWSSLKTAFEFYSKFLKYDVIPIHKMDEQLNDTMTQAKYLITEYPDLEFLEMMNQAINIHDKKHMYELFNKIVDYIHEKTGGFKLDGWSVRTPLSVSK